LLPPRIRGAFQTMARHESNWMKWKVDGCASVARCKVESSIINGARLRSDATSGVGTEELTELWNKAGDWKEILKKRGNGGEAFGKIIKDLDELYTSTGSFEEGIDAKEVEVDYTRLWGVYRVAVRREGVFASGSRAQESRVGEWEIVERWRKERDRGVLLSPDVEGMFTPPDGGTEVGTPTEPFKYSEIK
jgi:hypothetical protein